MQSLTLCPPQYSQERQTLCKLSESLEGEVQCANGISKRQIRYNLKVMEGFSVEVTVKLNPKEWETWPPLSFQPLHLLVIHLSVPQAGTLYSKATPSHPSKASCFPEIRPPMILQFCFLLFYIILYTSNSHCFIYFLDYLFSDCLLEMRKGNVIYLTHSLLHLQTLEQCLTHTSYALNIC